MMRCVHCKKECKSVYQGIHKPCRGYCKACIELVLDIAKLFRDAEELVKSEEVQN